MKRLIGDVMGFMDTILDVINLSIAMTVFFVVFPIIMQLAGQVQAMTKGIGKK